MGGRRGKGDTRVSFNKDEIPSNGTTSIVLTLEKWSLIFFADETMIRVLKNEETNSERGSTLFLRRIVIGDGGLWVI